MKVSEIRDGLEVAFLSPLKYWAPTKWDRDPINASRNSVMRGTIVSTQRYDHDHSPSAVAASKLPNTTLFNAPAGARSYRVMVKGAELNVDGEEVFYFVKPIDIVGEFAPIEERWLKFEAEQKRVLEEATRIEAERMVVHARETANIKRISDRIEPTMRSILGKMARPVTVQVASEWVDQYRGSLPKGIVQIDIRDMESLIEALLEARDALA